MTKNKQLDSLDRIQIENGINNRDSFKQIALSLGKSTSTISREVKRNYTPSEKPAPYRAFNCCASRTKCEKTFLCEEKPNCLKRCSKCKLCNSRCSDFSEEICSKLLTPPYVCNKCVTANTCTLRRKYYTHALAHKSYKEVLSESRKGVNISEPELLQLDEFISPLLKNGQSIHHVVANNPNQFSKSEKTIYRYVSDGLINAKNVDMPRICRLRPRKGKKLEHKVDKRCRINRKYSDYKAYLKEHSDVSVVEMDSVEGVKGGKVLLTLLFKSCDFMLAFIRDRNTAQSVIDLFNFMYDTLGHPTFCEMFPLLLTDNGSEFSNPSALEFNEEEIRRTTVFYCDPGASYQKPNVEVNHEFIRRILPKGSSFNDLDQDDISKMMNHINSYSRKKLNDKAPHELFGFIYGEDVLMKLGFEHISANDIVLKPRLLKKQQPVN